MIKDMKVYKIIGNEFPDGIFYTESTLRKNFSVGAEGCGKIVKLLYEWMCGNEISVEDEYVSLVDEIINDTYKYAEWR